MFIRPLTNLFNDHRQLLISLTLSCENPCISCWSSSVALLSSLRMLRISSWEALAFTAASILAAKLLPAISSGEREKRRVVKNPESWWFHQWWLLFFEEHNYVNQMVSCSPFPLCSAHKLISCIIISISPFRSFTKWSYEYFMRAWLGVGEWASQGESERKQSLLFLSCIREWNTKK